MSLEQMSWRRFFLIEKVGKSNLSIFVRGCGCGCGFELGTRGTKGTKLLRVTFQKKASVLDIANH
jgi:hypothetical protein